jgi:hypothetical protein
MEDASSEIRMNGQRYEGTLLKRIISYVKQGRITHIPNGLRATVFAEEALEVGTLI